MTAFTYQWTNRCRLNMLPDEGDALALSAGDAFTSRGVGAGDTIYVVVVNAGKLHLVGRMRVVGVSPRREWDRLHPGSDLWPGDEVVVGTDGTPMRFQRTLPTDVLRQIRFQTRQGAVKPLRVDEQGWFDPQSVRSVRRLTSESAELLEAYVA